MAERRQNNWALLLRKENDVPNLKSILRMWSPFVLVMSAFCGLVYLAIQQTLRHKACSGHWGSSRENWRGLQSFVP
jgi:hypothetical protein